MTGENQTASKEIEGPVVDETHTLGGQGSQERPPRGRDGLPTRTVVPQRVPSPQPQRGTSLQVPQGTRPEADQAVTFRQLTNILSNFQETLTATLQQQLRAQAASVPSTSKDAGTSQGPQPESKTPQPAQQATPHKESAKKENQQKVEQLRQVVRRGRRTPVKINWGQRRFIDTPKYQPR